MVVQIALLQILLMVLYLMIITVGSSFEADGATICNVVASGANTVELILLFFMDHVFKRSLLKINIKLIY